MQAVRFIGVGKPPQITDVPKPSPGAGQVLVRIGGAGVCHSDLHVMEEDLGFAPPFTLGHENAGWVAALGQGVTGFKEGDPVAVYGPWGCGRCHACQLSMENYCENWAQVDGFGGGLGRDGGMADYMLVPFSRLLVPLGDLSPANAAPLSDAALTPYHAIKHALPHLNPESTAVVLGVGGLGHMAIQLLRVLAPVTIVAADVDEKKLQQAKALGADHIVNNRNAAEAVERIQTITGRRGATLVLDCVGVQATVDLGAQILRRGSVWTIVGLGGGHHDFRHGSTPYGTLMSIPYWGSRVELMEVIAMARNGRIHAEITEFPLSQAVEVYGQLKAGEITGRAVLVPDGA
jgi:propanol-preferring alcohol dehydrogenase